MTLLNARAAVQLDLPLQPSVSAEFPPERRELIFHRLEPWIAKPFENHVGVHVIATRNL